MGKGKHSNIRREDMPVGPYQVRPGTYKIISALGGVALDYLASADDKSNAAISHSHHTEQQKWNVMLLGQGCCIQNANTGLYLTVEGGISNGVPIVASPNPVSWHIIPSRNETFKITWPNTKFVFDVPGNSTKPGTGVQLWSRYDDKSENQQWKFEHCDDSNEVTSCQTSVFTITTTKTISYSNHSDTDSDYTL